MIPFCSCCVCCEQWLFQNYESVLAIILVQGEWFPFAAVVFAHIIVSSTYFRIIYNNFRRTNSGWMIPFCSCGVCRTHTHAASLSICSHTRILCCDIAQQMSFAANWHTWNISDINQINLNDLTHGCNIHDVKVKTKHFHPLHSDKLNAFFFPWQTALAP